MVSSTPQENRFATTHWSLIVSAARQSSPHSLQALEKLCAAYWAPIYWHVRRLGHDATEAQDLTQGFFTHLLERRVLEFVDRERGKFRSFLLTSLRHFLTNEWKRENALKRGGGQTVFRMDFDSAESQYRYEPSHDLTADRLFDRRWAVTILETALKELEEQHRQSDKLELFEVLSPYLTADGDSPRYAEAASRLDMKPDAVKMAVSRLRKKYRQLIREEVQRTLSEGDDVDAEIRNLFEALG